MLEPFFEGVISGISQSTWSGAMVAWFERMSKCVHAEDTYFEKVSFARNPHMPPDLHIQKRMG